MICQPQLLGGSGDVPLVPLQGSHHDLTLGFPTEVLKRSFVVPCASRYSTAIQNVPGNVLDPKDVTVGSDDHTLDHIPQLPDVVLRPIVAHQNVKRFSGQLLRTHPEALRNVRNEAGGKLGDI
jgi:hypothetical protein